MSKVDKLFIGMYNDVYGGLLADNVRETVRLYYDCDLSLSEIAEQFGVSRQAVHDTLSRAEKQFTAYEEALRLVSVRQDLEKLLDDIENNGLSREGCVDVLKRIIGGVK